MMKFTMQNAGILGNGFQKEGPKPDKEHSLNLAMKTAIQKMLLQESMWELMVFISIYEIQVLSYHTNENSLTTE